MIGVLFEIIILSFKLTYYTIAASLWAITPPFLCSKKDLKGKNVLITGTGRGVGREMAIEFAKAGCNVVLWDINTKANLETAELVRKLNCNVKVLEQTVNLQDVDEITEAAAVAKNQLGAINVLVNNAGYASGKGLFECSPQSINLSFDVNVKSNFYTAKLFLSDMLVANSGNIVTVASIAGKVASAGLIDYTASKHAAVGFHDSLTSEIDASGKTGVKTTLVCPYYINTPMFDGEDAKTRIPWLLSVLDPNYVARRIVEAVQIDSEYLVMPRTVYFIIASASILPRKVCAILAESIKLVQDTSRFNRKE